MKTDKVILMKVMSVFGTRPEAIKMCPLVKKLEETEGIESVVCLTGQHREMLQQVIDIFGTKVKYNLDIMKPRQTLTTITSSILEKIEPVLIEEKPDIVLVHGDTTTSFVVALAAFYQQIPVGHVEAGLRTYDKYSPFPEEMNRNLTGKIADLHFAPTENNKNNLLREGINKNIFVTGQPLENICNAVKRLAEKYEDLVFVYPVHLNPAVRDTAERILGDVQNVYLIPPVDVEDMHNIMDRSFLVMTDSGGLQEEAPSCGVPVLVLRTETERPEAVEAGTVKVVGVDEDVIFNEAVNLIDNPSEYEKMAHAANPYGDGHASERIIKALCEIFEK